MEPVRIARAASRHPSHRISQQEARERLQAIVPARRREIAALSKGSHIESRATILAADDIASLGSIEARNGHYHRHAPDLAASAIGAVASPCDLSRVRCLVTSSCTGYSVPSLAVRLSTTLCMASHTTRVPITEAGCAGGLLAIAQAADFLRTRPGQAALAASVELCSLAFQRTEDEGNLMSALIFGDGAGAALLDTASGPGIEILDRQSVLVPDSMSALGFELTDGGFAPVLERRLVELLPGPTKEGVHCLLSRHGLTPADVGSWLLHPGGARILSRIESAFGLGRERTRWSWSSMYEHGNTSSAAIFDVISRYLEERAVANEWVLMIAFGPGVSIEMLLGRRRCS